jgi:hypothetical protein
LDATEDDDLLVSFVVCDDTHRVVADVVKLVAVVGELHANPNFLVKQKEVDIVQQWRDIVLAKGIVAAASNNDS